LFSLNQVVNVIFCLLHSHSFLSGQLLSHGGEVTQATLTSLNQVVNGLG